MDGLQGVAFTWTVYLKCALSCDQGVRPSVISGEDGEVTPNTDLPSHQPQLSVVRCEVLFHVCASMGRVERV